MNERDLAKQAAAQRLEAEDITVFGTIAAEHVFAALHDAGYAIVPREPTKEIVRAGGDADGMNVVNKIVADAQIRAGRQIVAYTATTDSPLAQAYRTMIAAADIGGSDHA